MNESKRYWFPAKRYGWGWGFPITWQGWVVFIGFFVSLTAGAFWFLPQHNAVGFVIYSTVIALALVFICYLKGEPPAWRWGKK